MAKLTQPETCERNLRQAYDSDYYGTRRNLVRFTLGEKLSPNAGGLSPSLSGEIPDDVDLMPRYYEPGQSRMIMTNAFLMAAKVCYIEPDPDYPEKARGKEFVTKAINRAMWKGRPHTGPTKFEEYGEWAPECHKAYLDGDGLGTGFVQIGVRDGWTTIQHHPLNRVIWDRNRSGVTRARYIAFVHYLSEEEAVAQFGTEIRKEVTSRGENEYALRTVKVVQYFDMGLGQNDPTEIWRLNSFGGKVLDISENEYGCLPFAHMEHIQMWGMRRAVGRIDFQVSDQQMRNAYERYLRLVLERGPGFDVMDTTGMDMDDLDALNEGELLTLIKLQLGPLGKVSDRIQRFPAQEPPMGLFKGFEYLDRMNPGTSGISDADRANVTSSQRTLGEIQEVQEGADSSKQWSQRQYALFLSRLFYKANYIAAKHHVAPTPISVNGVPILLNEPGNLQSRLEYWLTPHTWPVVNEDLLVRQSPLRKMQIADGKWMPLLMDPYMNPIEVRRALLEERGEKDPDRFLNPEAVMAAQGAQGGVMTDAMALSGRQEALPQNAQAA